MAIFDSKYTELTPAVAAFSAAVCVLVNLEKVEDVPYEIVQDKAERVDRLRQQIIDQRRWIEDHGGDHAGYVKRYGNPDQDHCYGDGGSAIYHADKAALDDLLLRASTEGVEVPE